MSNTHAHARFELNDEQISVNISGSEKNIAELIASAMIKDEDVKSIITKAVLLCIVEQHGDNIKDILDAQLSDMLKAATKYQA